jgi:hypothetical protein
MKRRVLIKTTPFHAFKKKMGTKRCRFEAPLFLLLLPLDVQQGKKKFCFFPLSPSPRALLKLKPDATDREVVPCKRPAHWTSHPVP